ncbi:MAG: hypothetical protein ACREBW_04695 [Candidatus Micrarchaeaceae archaeon]
MDTVIVGRDAGPDARSLEDAVRYAIEAYPNLKSFRIITHDHDCGGALIKWNMVKHRGNYGSEMATRVDDEDVAFINDCKEFVDYQKKQGELQKKRVNEILVKLGRDPKEYDVDFEMITVPPKDHSFTGDLCISAPLAAEDPNSVTNGILLCMDNRLNPEMKYRIGSGCFDQLQHKFDCTSDLNRAYHVQSVDPYELLPDIRAAVDVIGSKRVVVLLPDDQKLRMVFEEFAIELGKTQFMKAKDMEVEVPKERSKLTNRSV